MFATVFNDPLTLLVVDVAVTLWSHIQGVLDSNLDRCSCSHGFPELLQVIARIVSRLRHCHWFSY
jgi:hypothetical protein